MMGKALHSSASDNWGTPETFVKAVHGTLGGIDLDPCSDASRNKTVKAWTYYTKERNGLSLPWHGTVYCNPPGGRGLPRAFWEKGSYEINQGRCEALIFACFSIEQLVSGQGWHEPVTHETSICIVSKRVKWLHPDGSASHAPTHGAAFVLKTGAIENARAQEIKQQFLKNFEPLGKCWLNG